MDNYTTPLANAKGLGSAKSGTSHFWNQRLTALALIPLTFWLCFSIAALPGMDYDSIVDWLGKPLNAVLMILILISGFYHAQLGLQVIIEDYVSDHRVRTAGIILVNFVSILLGTLGVFSVLKIALGN